MIARVYLAISGAIARWRIHQSLHALQWYEDERAALWSRMSDEYRSLDRHRAQLADIETQRMRLGRSGKKIVA